MTTIVSPKGVEMKQQIVKKENTGTYLYIGFADSGAGDSDAVHAICRKTLATGIVLWKTGGYSNTWTDRASGTYQ